MARAKQLIGKIMRSKGEVFTVADAAICLDLSSEDTAKTLARWAKQGWLIRLKRGLYAVVAIDASSTERVLAEPWVLIPQLFKSCYVGGWSAAEHWGLTEQIFYDICVVSDSARVKKTQRVQNINFVATKVSSERLFGSKVIWKNNTKVMVSDPHKTIVDMLYDPLLGGGIQHVVDCFREYQQSEYRDFIKLGDYAERMRSGAILKRLGFLAERDLGREHVLTTFCAKALSQGNAYLDPKQKGGRLITRWRLLVPDSYKE